MTKEEKEKIVEERQKTIVEPLREALKLIKSSLAAAVQADIAYPHHEHNVNQLASISAALAEAISNLSSDVKHG